MNKSFPHPPGGRTQANAIRLIAGFLILLAPMTSRAEIDLVVTLSTNRVSVGDRIDMTVSAIHADHQRMAVPSLNREPFILVWDSQSEQRALKDGRRETVARFTFSSFVIGEHRVSTNPIVVLTADGDDHAMPFPEVVIHVVSVLTNPPPALADIKPPATLPGHPWLRILWMILTVVIIAFLCALLIRYFLTRPRTAPAMKAISPYEIALTALNALLKRGFIEQGAAEPFYVELSAIVRVYLEDRFHLHAPEQTTEEFIRASSHSSALSTEHRTLTQQFLEQSDLVKFARFEPKPGDMRNAWDAAARLIRETIPAALPPQAGGPP